MQMQKRREFLACPAQKQRCLRIKESRAKRGEEARELLTAGGAEKSVAWISTAKSYSPCWWLWSCNARKAWVDELPEDKESRGGNPLRALVIKSGTEAWDYDSTEKTKKNQEKKRCRPSRTQNRKTAIFKKRRNPGISAWLYSCMYSCLLQQHLVEANYWRMAQCNVKAVQRCYWTEKWGKKMSKIHAKNMHFPVIVSTPESDSCHQWTEYAWAWNNRLRFCHSLTFGYGSSKDIEVAKIWSVFLTKGRLKALRSASWYFTGPHIKWTWFLLLFRHQITIINSAASTKIGILGTDPFSSHSAGSAARTGTPSETGKNDGRERLCLFMFRWHETWALKEPSSRSQSGQGSAGDRPCPGQNPKGEEMSKARSSRPQEIQIVFGSDM